MSNSENSEFVRVFPVNPAFIDFKQTNPVLKDGELVVDRSSGQLKIGDGVTSVKNLPFLTPVLNESGGVDSRSAVSTVDGDAWLEEESGTGTLVENGDTLTIQATDDGDPYTVGFDTLVPWTTKDFISFEFRRDAELSVLDIFNYVQESGDNSFTLMNKGVSAVPVGEWFTVSCPLGESELDNNLPADPADINFHNSFRIRVTPTSGNSTDVDIRNVRINRAEVSPAVSFLFDDGRDDTFDVAFPILKAKNFRAGVAPEYTQVGSAGRVTLAELTQLYRNGWDVVGHHNAGMTGLTDSQQIAIHRDVKHFLATNGFERGDHIWVWPGGQSDSNSESIASRYWDCMRTISSFSVIGAPGYYASVRPPVVYIQSTTSLSDLTDHVDRVANYGGSVVFIVHSVLESGLAIEDISLDNFTDLVEHVAGSNVNVVSPSEIWTPLN